MHIQGQIIDIHQKCIYSGSVHENKRIIESIIEECMDLRIISLLDLLIIPQFKLRDKGFFDGEKVEFLNLI